MLQQLPVRFRFEIENVCVENSLWYELYYFSKTSEGDEVALIKIFERYLNKIFIIYE